MGRSAATPKAPSGVTRNGADGDGRSLGLNTILRTRFTRIRQRARTRDACPVAGPYARGFGDDYYAAVACGARQTNARHPNARLRIRIIGLGSRGER